MAVRGVSLAEREQHILKDDPAHPDQIIKETEKRLSAIPFAEREARRPSIEDNVREEAGKPTVFFIGNLTKADRVELGDMTNAPIMRDGGIIMDSRRVKRAYELVQRGLKGWENFLDASGRVVAFQEGTIQNAGAGFSKGVHPEVLAHLSQEQMLELANAVLDKNGMRTELEKNFAGASQPSAANPSVTGDAPIVSTINVSNEDAPNQP
jgi:hypothetical protein